MRIKNWFIYSFLFLVFLFTGCNNDPIPKPLTYFIESEEVYSPDSEFIKNYYTFGGATTIAARVKYDIILYKVKYNTEYLGSRIMASGLVAFPVTKEEVPMVSIQHGTIVAHDEAPSVNWNSYSSLAMVASTGYIVVIPDFIGFGESEQVLHPYYHEISTASSVIDMMLSVKEMAGLEGFDFNGEVFLAGYSEGGYATMATHKKMEEEKVEGLSLIASAPAAGGYDIKGMQEYFFGRETYANPFYIAYVAMAYKGIYGWDNPLSDYFKEPYATRIPQYFNGMYSGGGINAQLTTNVGELLSDDFLFNSDNNSIYDPLFLALNENSLHNWVPKKTMFLYHGTDDLTIPYENSVNTYNTMISNGASSSIISLIALSGYNHSTGWVPYFLDVVERFEKLK